ncbi:MAG: hypothetical protein AAGD06_19990 [Acidobacteriota bacterium]
MTPLEAVVYLSVWGALLCYPAAAVGRGTRRPGVQRQARWVWTAGGVLFWIHVASAFAAFYGGSHAVALEVTAQRTLETTGVDSGVGLYLNYAFALLWGIEAAWWWRRPESYLRRPSAVFLCLHGFFLFMLVNGAVIFVPGPRRWLGALVTAAGAAAVVWGAVRGRLRPGA